MELNRETMKKILDGIDLKEAPPTEEPARQYYFMASARKRLADRFAAELSTGEAARRYGQEELSRMQGEGACGTAAVINFGCQMNAKDASKLVNWLKQTQISTLNLSHHFLSNTLLTRKSQVLLN